MNIDIKQQSYLVQGWQTNRPCQLTLSLPYRELNWSEKKRCPNDKTDTVVRGRTVKTGSGLGLINEEKNVFVYLKKVPLLDGESNHHNFKVQARGFCKLFLGILKYKLG